jgi:4-amino-4-deoxy-L-arabinose transferase-like glycosyltransferase
MGESMTEARRLTLAEVLLLAAIVALAGGVRAGYLMYCADEARSDGPLLVEAPLPELNTLVHNLKDHNRFVSRTPFGEEEKDTAHVAPGYPFVMSLVARLVDDASLPSTMRWIQCGLGALTAGLYFLFSRRAFQSTLVATLAGLLGAIHPFWIVDTATLADGVVATFLLGLALFLGVRANQTSGPLSSLLYGLALAGLALVRAALLPFAFVALAWFLMRSRALTRGWLCALLAFLGFVNGMAPWVVRNWQRYGEPLPVVDSTYYHLWMGNNPQATGGPLERETHYAERTDRERFFAEEIRKEIRNQPAETVRRRLLAGLVFLFGERWLKEGKLANQTEASMPDWLAWPYPIVLQSTLLVLIVLGLLGWRWTYGWRHHSMPAALAMVWIPLPYILSHAESLSGPRLPLDGVLLCYVAFVLACLFPGRGRLLEGESVEGSAADGR